MGMKIFVQIVSTLRGSCRPLVVPAFPSHHIRLVEADLDLALQALRGRLLLLVPEEGGHVLDTFAEGLAVSDVLSNPAWQLGRDGPLRVAAVDEKAVKCFRWSDRVEESCRGREIGSEPNSQHGVVARVPDGSSDGLVDRLHAAVQINCTPSERNQLTGRLVEEWMEKTNAPARRGRLRGPCSRRRARSRSASSPSALDCEGSGRGGRPSSKKGEI